MMAKTANLPNHVIPLVETEYPKWHKGRLRYGLWYIPIEDMRVAECCQKLRAALSPLFAKGYDRQWHITVFVNGFYVDVCRYEDDFDDGILQHQINAIQALQLPKFSLTTRELGSFLNCAYLSVAPSDILTRIRAVLAYTHQEIAPSDYIPHITLGMYQQAFDFQRVINQLRQITVEAMQIQVDRLIFATFHPNQLQGRLTTHQTIWLK